MIHRQSRMALVVLSAIVFFSSLVFGDTASGAKPNVIFVLADDLGIGDISATNPNCKIKTPFLQRMADEGITFLRRTFAQRGLHADSVRSTYRSLQLAIEVSQRRT